MISKSNRRVSGRLGSGSMNKKGVMLFVLDITAVAVVLFDVQAQKLKDFKWV